MIFNAYALILKPQQNEGIWEGNFLLHCFAELAESGHALIWSYCVFNFVSSNFLKFQNTRRSKERFHIATRLSSLTW